MKVAVPDWRGRVSPVFDVAEQVLLIDFDSEGEEGSRRTENLGSVAPHDRARQLTELGVAVVVCGAISWPLEALLTAGGIRVIALICGEVEDVVRAFRDGTLDEERYALPGSRRKRPHARNLRRGGRTHTR